MICPSCKGENVYVIDSRNKHKNRRDRRYKCTDCGYRFNTMEVLRTEFRTMDLGHRKWQAVLKVISEEDK